MYNFNVNKHLSSKTPTYFPMRNDLNFELSSLSSELFGELEENDYRILKNIAEEGFLSIKEISDRTSAWRYTEDPIKRWKVKHKIIGSTKYIGLEPNEFVYSIKKNKKETKYGLTLKGLCAILSETSFEGIYIVKKYREFLLTLTDDKKIRDWGIEFIKYEIALILSYNVDQGLNWTNLKYVREYWNDFKLYDDPVVQKFFINKIFRTKPTYVSIQRKYLKLFYILDKCTSRINCSFNSEYYEEPLEINDPLRKYIDRWYLFIDKYKHGRYPSPDKWEEVDERTSFDREFWKKKCYRPMIEANRILKKEGYTK